MLVRCLYASRATQSPISKLTDSILKTSRENNPAKGITGFLCVSGDVFLQVLEGGRDEVCELFNRIVKDERHANVRLLAYQEIRQRKFGNWTMGQVDLSKINTGLQLLYVLAVISHRTSGMPPPEFLIIAGAAVLVTSTVSGLVYVVRWHGRAIWSRR